MADEDTPTTATAEKTIPKTRFDEVNTRRVTAEARAVTLEAQLADIQAQAAAAGTLQERLAELTTTLETERTTRATERTLLEAGLTDPEAWDVATFLHGRLAADDRPELGAWLATAKAAPGEAPKALRPYLGPAPAAAATDAPAAAPRGATGKLARGLPDAARTRAGVRATTTGGGFTAEQLRGMGTAEYAANREAILAQIGKKG